MNLKKISEQTIVITGATSGIGLTTARMAAEKGAKLVLVARNEAALRELAAEINAASGRAIYSVADVADENALRGAAQKAKAEFGGFDTWVNNAGGSVYGRITDVPTEDLRRLFETNVWGVVNGSRIAVEHLRERGGALLMSAAKFPTHLFRFRECIRLQNTRLKVLQTLCEWNSKPTNCQFPSLL